MNSQINRESRHFYEFGPFRIDTANRLLLRDRKVVPLTSKVFDILLALVQNSGNVLDKEELMKHVWPDSFVEEGNLSRNISTLRKVLGESPEDHRYIVTISGRGYRFVASVREVLDGDPGSIMDRPGPWMAQQEEEEKRIFGEQVEAQPEKAGKVLEAKGDLAPALQGLRQRLFSLPRWPLLVGVILLMAAAVVVYFFLLKSSAPNQVWVIKPLTTFVGGEEGITWSPDGSFFAYSHTATGGMDIFVKATGGGDPLRLTTDPADDVLPRWSPDGRTLAFLSDRGTGTNVYLIPPLGGDERKLVETNLPYLERFDDAWGALGAVPWSPDGKELLFSRLQRTGRIAVWKVNPVTGKETQVTSPKLGSDDICASWSFDGELIVIERRRGGLGSLWLLPARGGEPFPLLSDEFDNIMGAWSADSRRIVFVSNRAGAQSLWEVDISSHRLRQLTTGAANWYPAVARSGTLGYEQFSQQVDLHSIRIDSSIDERLTFYTHENYAPRFSPDGRKLIYHSNRTGNDEIWMLDLETKVERQLTHHPATDVLPDWSPDGQEIVFLSNREREFQVWAMHSDGSGLRRIAEQAVPLQGVGCTALRLAPRWSPDGKTIGYIAPTEQGTALWVVDRDGRNARPYLSNILRFDWYRDSRHAIYTRAAVDGSGAREMGVANLDTGEEAVLYRG
ncbi:MAG: winged helix-turn-helix domain-containing protein, partial [Terriglobia bacterium]